MTLELRRVTNSFSIAGLQLRPAAAKVFIEALYNQENGEAVLEQMVAVTKLHLDRADNPSKIIDANVAMKVVEQMHAEDVEVTAHTEHLQDGIFVLDVFKDVEKYRYDTSSKEFRVVSERPRLCASAEAKSNLFRDRFLTVQQRLLRDPRFMSVTEMDQIAAGGVCVGKARNAVAITPVESLVGNPGRKYTFGMLSQLEPHRMYIEDLHKAVPVNLEKAHPHHGFICEGSLVLCEGEMVDGEFVVDMISLPPAEPRQCSKTGGNHFGGRVTQVDLETLAHIENPEAMYVVLSDAFLDTPETHEKIEKILAGYAQRPPTGIIFMGSFCSTPFAPTAEGVRRYKEGFKRLADTLAKYPDVSLESYLIFIPGPNDPGADLLPRPPLPVSLVGDMGDRFPRVVLATNPCRIRHYHREIVVCRADLTHKLMRTCEFSQVGENPTQEKIKDEVIRTLADSAHLCPLPYTTRPILWDFDHTLWLYPLPDAVILGDSVSQWHGTYTHTNPETGESEIAEDLKDCIFMNAGPFTNSDGEFMSYFPYEKAADSCQV